MIRLEDNYRSSPDIIRAANLSIHGVSPERWSSSPHTEADKAPHLRRRTTPMTMRPTWLAETIRGLIAQGYAASDIAVLHRFSAQALLTEGALRAAGVSVRSTGGNTVLRPAPRQTRGNGNPRSRRGSHARGTVSHVVADILFGLGLHQRRTRPSGCCAVSTWEDSAGAFGSLADSGLVRRSHSSEFSEELIRRAQAHDEPTMESVTLATVHAAKGQEWPVVCVVGLSEGPIPHLLCPHRGGYRRGAPVVLRRHHSGTVNSWCSAGRSARKNGVGSDRQMSRFLGTARESSPNS